MTPRTEIDIQDLLLIYCNNNIGVRFYDKRPAAEELAGVVEIAANDCGTEIQRAIAYVLVYVPDIIAGGEYTRDRTAVRIWERACARALERFNGGEYRFELIGQSCQQYEDGKSHLISNQLLIQFNNE